MLVLTCPARYGEVIETEVVFDKEGKSRGFGFVTFAALKSAQAAFGEEQRIDGRILKLSYAVPKRNQTASTTRKLYVTKLADLTMPELQDYFSQFGRVEEAKVIMDHAANRSKGFGFVLFEEPIAVDKCMEVGATKHVIGSTPVIIDRASDDNKSNGSGEHRRGDRPDLRHLLRERENERSHHHHHSRSRSRPRSHSRSRSRERNDRGGHHRERSRHDEPLPPPPPPPQLPPHGYEHAYPHRADQYRHRDAPHAPLPPLAPPPPPPPPSSYIRGSSSTSAPHQRDHHRRSRRFACLGAS